jgi:hypothetical protein
MADPIIKYLGDASLGEHYYGIRARDLSASEYDALSTDQRALVRSGNLYAYSDYRDAVAKAKDREDAKAAKDAAKASDATDTAPADKPALTK